MANMKVILLETLHGVGKIGDQVSVKAGFGRNFLLPRAKALLANKDNLAKFEAQRAKLESDSSKAKSAAEKTAEKFKDLTLTLTRHASETGQLYGSVKARDLGVVLAEKQLEVPVSEIMIGNPIKEIGEHSIKVALHPEVIVTVPVIVERQSM